MSTVEYLVLSRTRNKQVLKSLDKFQQKARRLQDAWEALVDGFYDAIRIVDDIREGFIKYTRPMKILLFHPSINNTISARIHVTEASWKEEHGLLKFTCKLPDNLRVEFRTHPFLLLQDAIIKPVIAGEAKAPPKLVILARVIKKALTPSVEADAMRKFNEILKYKTTYTGYWRIIEGLGYGKAVVFSVGSSVIRDEDNYVHGTVTYLKDILENRTDSILYDIGILGDRVKKAYMWILDTHIATLRSISKNAYTLLKVI